jgi:hypothetical protein
MPPPRRRSLELEKLEDEIAQIVVDLELYTYYQLLDLQPEGSCGVAEYNYNLKVHEYKKIQKDHRASAQLVQALQLIVDRMDEAREVLSSPTLRAEYDEGLTNGHTRHVGMARQRAIRSKTGPVDERQRLVEDMVANLKRGMDKKLIDAPDAVVPDVTEGIEDDLLDQESKQLTGELAGYGVKIDITEEAPEQYVPIEKDYLEEATEDLRVKIYKDGATLYEITEREAVSASTDKEMLAGLTDQLHQELAEMGVPEKDEVAPEALVPDAEFINQLVWQEQAAVIDLKVDTSIKADEELHARDISRDLASALSDELQNDLDRMGVDYKKPVREPDPTRETGPMPVPLIFMEDQPPARPGTLALPKSVQLGQPEPPREQPAPAFSRSGLGGKDPEAEVETFDLVIPLDLSDDPPEKK